jgi:hypothetical protein
VHEGRRAQLHQRELRDAVGELVGVRDRALVEERVPAAEGGEEDVLVAPQDALGHARGAARVGAEHVVAGSGPEPPLGRGGGQGVLVGGRALRDRFVGAVLDRHQVVQLRQPDDHRAQPGAELAGEEDGHEVGVLEQVVQLPLDVPVVDVDGDGPQLEGGEHPLEVLGPVEQLEAHVVAGAHPGRLQVVGQPVGALVQLGVGQSPSRGGHRLPVGYGVGHPLVQLAEVEAHRRTIPWMVRP